MGDVTWLYASRPSEVCGDATALNSEGPSAADRSPIYVIVRTPRICGASRTGVTVEAAVTPRGAICARNGMGIFLCAAKSAASVPPRIMTDKTSGEYQKEKKKN